MKKRFLRVLSSLLVVVMIVGSAPLSGFVGLDLPNWADLFTLKADAAAYSGKCGDNLTWSLDTDTGVLTISGTGDMYNWTSSSSSAPWYSYRSSIKTVVIGNSVTSIGVRAFTYCTGLTSVTIPDSVTSIGGSAFTYCTGLTSVTIPDSVTSIGYSAFAYCTSLTSVTIPDSVTSIGSSAFNGTGIYNNSSNWENNVLYIGNRLIKAKSSISGDYTIKSGTKTIADYAFASCTSLTSVTIPDSVTSIGDEAFYDCTGLTSVTIGNSVTSIGSDAFFECYCLTSIAIPDSVTSIGEYAFYNTGIYNNESNWENDVLYIGNHLIEAKSSIIGDYSIKSGTKTIADNAFNYCKSITSVTIPDSVTSIGDEAFYRCTGLTSVTIPDSATSIGDEAFWGCDSLTSVTIGNSVTSIGSDAFCDCDSLTSVTIGNSVTSIGNGAFSSCDSLTSVTIPDSVTSIGRSAFAWCDSLTSVTIPDSVTSIGGGAFYECYSLTRVTIGNSVTSIGDHAFYCCHSLTSVTIPDSATSIGEYAFYDCDSLTSVTIPDSVTSIGRSAFAWCTSLTSVTIPDSVTSIGESAFIRCYSLTSITIGESVTSIGDYAFYYCNSLTSVTIPDSVRSIGVSAFSDCYSLTSVTIPDSVTNIGSYAFASCTALKDVYYTGTEEEWNKISFGTYNDSLLNANIHYNSSGEEPDDQSGYDIPEDIVFLEMGEHYLFTVRDKDGNDATSKVTWSSQSSVDQQGEVEVVSPGDIKATKEGLTTVFVSYVDENNKIYMDSCDVFIGKPNNLEYTYIQDTEYYYGENGFYSDTLGISNTADIYLNLKNAVNQTIDFYSQYEKYDDDFAVLDLGGFKITATVSGDDLSFSDTEYKNTYSQTFKKIPIGKSVDDLLVLYPYNFNVGSNKKPYTVSIKIESDDFETITDTFSFNISALEYKAVNEHIDFVNKNATYRSSKNSDFASKMLPLKDDSQYIWAKYTTFDFENYYDVLFADVLADMLSVSQFENISFLPVVKEWVGNYKTILDGVSTMVEDDYTGYLDITENAIDKLLKKSKFTNEGIYNDDELYQTVLDVVGNASNTDKITKAFAAMDKTKQVGGFVKLGVNLFNDIIDSVNTISVINSYKNLTDNNFKVVVQKLYDTIPDYETKAKKAVYRYINLETSGGYTEEMFRQVFDLAGEMTIDVFKSVYKKQVISLLCNAVGKIKLSNGTLLSSTATFSGISAAFGAFATGVSLGLCISDILCNNSGQAEKMGKVVAAAEYAPYVIDTLEYFETNMKSQKTATSLSQFEHAFSLHKSVQLYSMQNTYDALEIQANSIIIKLFSKRDYEGAMSDIASLKTTLQNCNCCNYAPTGKSGTKTIEIKCPVNVIVYDENGAEVAKIINDTLEFAADNITVFINDSHKYITVPANQKYFVEIIATGSGTMSYSVTEYDETSQRIRTVNNENISLTVGAMFNGEISEELSPDAVSYKLECNNKEVLPTQTINVPVTGVSISVSDILIKNGDVYSLNATIYPADATDSTVAWHSDNESVATVDSNGQIKAVGVGTATITVTSIDGEYIAICNVNVSPADKVNSASVDDIEMNYKKTATLNTVIDADEGVNYTVEYTSSNPSVVSVDEEGNVYGAKKGSAEITVTVTDEYGNTVSDTCTVNVKYSVLQWIIIIVLFGWIWY